MLKALRYLICGFAFIVPAAVSLFSDVFETNYARFFSMVIFLMLFVLFTKGMDIILCKTLAAKKAYRLANEKPIDVVEAFHIKYRITGYLAVTPSCLVFFSSLSQNNDMVLHMKDWESFSVNLAGWGRGKIFSLLVGKLKVKTRFPDGTKVMDTFYIGNHAKMARILDQNWSAAGLNPPPAGLEMLK